MNLAGMIALDEGALICDMAETYHIYDMRALPAETLATLACGLREDSRIKMKRAGLKYVPLEVLLVRVHDLLLRWFLAHAKKSPKEKDLLATDIVEKQTIINTKKREVASRRSLFV